MTYKDIFGCEWGSLRKADMCPVCGQPALLGPCDHKEMDEAKKVQTIVALINRQKAPAVKRKVKVRRIYWAVTDQHWDMVTFDKEDCDDHSDNNSAIKHATRLIRAGRPFVFVPYNPE